MGQKENYTGHRLAISQSQIQQIQKIAKTIRFGSFTLVFLDGILFQFVNS